MPQLQFNIELEESDALADDYQAWKTSDVLNNRPPTMIVETYLSTKDLLSNQSLVVYDEFGKRWDVEDAIRSFYSARSSLESRQASFDVVLERWNIELGDTDNSLPKDLGVILPKVYKNSIVLFRSLFTMMNLLPAWKLSKKSQKSRPTHQLPKLHYRVYQSGESPVSSGIDNLSIPLPETQSQPIQDYFFGRIESPAGPFSIAVSYRSNCDFRIENSEAILSSQFIDEDEDMFKPSLRNRSDQSAIGRRGEPGSLPQAQKDVAESADQGQVYGSLSTFHNFGARTSSSPLGALRAAREQSAASSSDSPPVKAPPDHRPSQGSRASSRTDIAPGMARRTSVTFMPFKSPSLSASPLQGEHIPTSSPRNTAATAPRSSALTALAEARNPGLVQHKEPPTQTLAPIEPVAPSSGSSSPRPTPRYSSSFGHRRSRLSTDGSKGEEDKNSSGRASVSSSNQQPGSGLMTEGGRGGSSGSLQTDDDNISDFLKMLDQKKDLKSFRSPSDSGPSDSAARRTTVALSKFQRLRDSNAVLSDSMSSSMMGHRSSSSSSRQLSSVPPMVGGTSISTSSSPGERMSPRTPHTPAIPSRLSANSIIDYTARERNAERERIPENEEPNAEGRGGPSATRDLPGAIDIPTSPRAFHPSFRRSSSVAQQHRTFTYDEDNLGDILPFGLRSASLGGGEEREPLSLSALVALQEDSGVGVPMLGQANNSAAAGVDMTRQRSSSSQDDRQYDGAGTTRGAVYRPRIGRGSGRGQTPPHGSSTSLVGDRGSGSGSSDQRGGRYSFPRSSANFEDEEPLLFAMSELGSAQHGRRSLEDGRRGSSDTGGSGEAASRRAIRRGMHGWS